jgi:hypothetical protein
VGFSCDRAFANGVEEEREGFSTEHAVDLGRQFDLPREQDGVLLGTFLAEGHVGVAGAAKPRHRVCVRFDTLAQVGGQGIEGVGDHRFQNVVEILTGWSTSSASTWTRKRWASPLTSPASCGPTPSAVLRQNALAGLANPRPAGRGISRGACSGSR